MHDQLTLQVNMRGTKVKTGKIKRTLPTFSNITNFPFT